MLAGKLYEERGIIGLLCRLWTRVTDDTITEYHFIAPLRDVNIPLFHPCVAVAVDATRGSRRYCSVFIVHPPADVMLATLRVKYSRLQNKGVCSLARSPLDENRTFDALLASCPSPFHMSSLVLVGKGKAFHTPTSVVGGVLVSPTSV